MYQTHIPIYCKKFTSCTVNTEKSALKSKQSLQNFSSTFEVNFNVQVHK